MREAGPSQFQTTHLLSSFQTKPLGKDVRGQKSASKSPVFKIFTYKSCVMNILRGILQVMVRKLLILDILQNRGGRGGLYFASTDV